MNPRANPSPRISASTIFQAIVEQGAAFSLPEPWQRLPCCPSFFRLPDPQQLGDHLRRRFLPADLLAAGVFQPDTCGTLEQLVLRPSLRDPQGLGWALRVSPEASPYNLIVAMESVHPRGWAPVAPLRDHRCAAIFQKEYNRRREEIPVMALGMADLAVFWSLGICALPAVDCVNLTQPQYASMRRAFAIGFMGDRGLKPSFPADFNSGFTTIVYSIFNASTVDTSTVDASAVDTSAVDTSAVDTSAVDTSTVDISAVDIGTDTIDIDIGTVVIDTGTDDTDPIADDAFAASAIDPFDTSVEFVTATAAIDTAIYGRAHAVVTEVDDDEIHTAKGSEYPLSLYIPLWSPSALLQSKEIPEARLLSEQLLKLKVDLDLDFSFAVTQLAAEARESLRTHLKFSTPERIEKVVREMLEDNSIQTSEPQRIVPRISYGTALGIYLKAQRTPGANLMSESQVAHLHRLLDERERQLFAPFDQLVVSTPDPLKQSKLAVTANLNRMFHEHSLAMLVSTEQRRHGGMSGEIPSASALRLLLDMGTKLSDFLNTGAPSRPAGRKHGRTKSQKRL